MPSSPRLPVAGAAGQLGGQVLPWLLETVPAADVVATVRAHRPGDAAARLSALGIEVRLADYDGPDALDTALRHRPDAARVLEQPGRASRR